MGPIGPQEVCEKWPKPPIFWSQLLRLFFFRSWKIKLNPKKLKKNRYVGRACTGEQKSRKSKIGKNDLKHPQTITGAHIKGFWIDSNALTYHMITPINGQNSISQKSADSRSQNLKANSQQMKSAGCSALCAQGGVKYSILYHFLGTSRGTLGHRNGHKTRSYALLWWFGCVLTHF